MGLRDLVYRRYERRLQASLSPGAIPRHVGVMCDGNRRWARSAGFRDVSKGHRKGADKIFELLDWCRETGVEVVTLWLLSTDNLTRPASELVPLLKIIEDTVQGIVEGTIEWTEDPDFGYEVAAAIPGVDDIEILQPRRLYARQGRTDEHDAMVARLKRERREFLNSFPGLDESLVKSLG